MIFNPCISKCFVLHDVRVRLRMAANVPFDFLFLSLSLSLVISLVLFLLSRFFLIFFPFFLSRRFRRSHRLSWHDDVESQPLKDLSSVSFNFSARRSLPRPYTIHVLSFYVYIYIYISTYVYLCRVRVYTHVQYMRLSILQRDMYIHIFMLHIYVHTRSHR